MKTKTSRGTKKKRTVKSKRKLSSDVSIKQSKRVTVKPKFWKDTKKEKRCPACYDILPSHREGCNGHVWMIPNPFNSRWF